MNKIAINLPAKLTMLITLANLVFAFPKAAFEQPRIIPNVNAIESILEIISIIESKVEIISLPEPTNLNAAEPIPATKEKQIQQKEIKKHALKWCPSPKVEGLCFLPYFFSYNIV